jgi:hypothetical protein
MSIPFRRLAELTETPEDYGIVTVLLRAVVMYPEVAAELCGRNIKTYADRGQAVTDAVRLIDGDTSPLTNGASDALQV